MEQGHLVKKALVEPPLDAGFVIDRFLGFDLRVEPAGRFRAVDQFGCGWRLERFGNIGVKVESGGNRIEKTATAGQFLEGSGARLVAVKRAPVVDLKADVIVARPQKQGKFFGQGVFLQEVGAHGGDGFVLGEQDFVSGIAARVVVIVPVVRLVFGIDSGGQTVLPPQEFTRIIVLDAFYERF